MIISHIGEISALLVSVCWTISALFFENAAKRIGTLSVNFIRLLVAILFIGLVTIFTKGLFFPTDATQQEWFWLGISGFVGFFVGDLLLFKSYTIIGSRTSALIMSISPMLTAIIGRIFLGERLSSMSLIAMVLSTTGILIAIVNKNMKLNIPFKGSLFAFGGALGQSVGLILGKKGLEHYDALAATQIRAFFGLFGFILLISLLKQWRRTFKAFVVKEGLRDVTIGAFFGPFVGVSLALFSIQHTQTGIASTLMALVPIFIIWPSAIWMKEKIKLQHIIGAIVSVIGVCLFFV